VFDHVRQEFEVVQVAQRVHRVVQRAKERETGKRKNKTLGFRTEHWVPTPPPPLAPREGGQVQII
jgi:hypothetical protein